MPSTYTPLLRLTLPADGELVGTWGQAVNTGVTALIEAAISGTLALAMPDANYTLVAANGATDEARNAVLQLSGTLTATRDLIVPASSKTYFVRNDTNQSVVVKTSGGTGITVPTGKRMLVYCDGTNVIEPITRITADVVGNVTGNASGNAATATALQTARTINGVSFDGTANITLPDTSLANTAFLDRVKLNQGIF